jgi:hypothetical protein
MSPVLPSLAALVVAGGVAAAPVRPVGPHGFTTPPLALPAPPAFIACAGPLRPEPVPGLAPGRFAVSTVAAPGSGVLRFVAGLGASLAWELADLPRHQARLPEPVGGFVPGAAFGVDPSRAAAAEGGAIGALIARWNELYPPYAVTGPGGP